MMNISVEIAGLRVVRGGRTVLPGLDLVVPAGQVVGLLGPSGCGKTTLIRSIAGVQRLASGRVTVLGEPAGSPANRTRVGYVTQAASVYPDLTVAQNLAYFAALAGTGRAEAGRALEAVDLTGHRSSLAGALSGGQRTRVSLAAALLGDPRLLLLDEPTVGLDPVLRRDLWQLFGRLAAEGRTLLVSSHVMDEAARCDRVLLMREGRIVADDTPDGLRTRSGTQDLEQAFLTIAEQAATA
ncbi:ABC transporter ATP-binding protein [Aeromicrobium sp. IC_218]|uniref:ABC transporter ATP-binding protein n=1 Tax=Aeromicrobium sp. IC_218 TaxID=2545468 RepID=UPI00103ECF4D|nr:ABC transporter ATP-binding protein [Aeromicrobium sp. IC_218]TCI99191.1 ABC transporter ATP-binding protein [Aeromicrobium sp. IC_218]